LLCGGDQVEEKIETGEAIAVASREDAHILWDE
jgi:hypothetical protein